MYRGSFAKCVKLPRLLYVNENCPEQQFGAIFILE